MSSFKAVIFAGDSQKTEKIVLRILYDIGTHSKLVL
jgi:hypothetical protein